MRHVQGLYATAWPSRTIRWPQLPESSFLLRQLFLHPLSTSTRFHDDCGDNSDEEGDKCGENVEPHFHGVYKAAKRVTMGDKCTELFRLCQMRVTGRAYKKCFVLEFTCQNKQCAFFSTKLCDLPSLIVWTEVRREPRSRGIFKSKEPE
ncbi:hypothetical protein RRG08_018616 [Elysia crispata]|uniref:Uncharacterized protein n=1 Tax=Elysia crispata TaxID=231223 RepID=A0AAE1E485_9GAST|nr:hypothetical protein RRG08_018616 [Elysia crispata]